LLRYSSFLPDMAGNPDVDCRSVGRGVAQPLTIPLAIK